MLPELSTYWSLFLSNIMRFVFCLTLITYMRYALENQNNSHSRYSFKRLVLFTIWSLIADMSSYIFDARQFFGARVLSHLSMIASVFLTTYVGYLLNTFFDVVFHVKAEDNKRKNFYFIPVVLISLLLIINIFTGWIFVIPDTNVYVRGPYALVSFFIQYLAFATVAVRAAFFKLPVKTQRYVKLRKYFIWGCVISLIFGFFQIITSGKIAFQCLGVTSCIFIIFLRFQEDQITNDLLTGLNNRSALDAYIADKMRSYPDGSHGGTSLYLIMMDVNFFKRINDNYGHVEGDNAIKTVANTLRRVIENYENPPFLARFGGDEFAAVFEANSDNKVRLLCENFKKTLAEETRDSRYLLTIGTGFAVYTGRGMSIEAFYDRADKALYEDKDRIKNGHGRD